MERHGNDASRLDPTEPEPVWAYTDLFITTRLTIGSQWIGIYLSANHSLNFHIPSKNININVSDAAPGQRVRRCYNRLCTNYSKRIKWSSSVTFFIRIKYTSFRNNAFSMLCAGFSYFVNFHSFAVLQFVVVVYSSSQRYFDWNFSANYQSTPDLNPNSYSTPHLVKTTAIDSLDELATATIAVYSQNTNLLLMYTRKAHEEHIRRDSTEKFVHYVILKKVVF